VFPRCCFWKWLVFELVDWVMKSHLRQMGGQHPTHEGLQEQKGKTKQVCLCLRWAIHLLPWTLVLLIWETSESDSDLCNLVPRFMFELEIRHQLSWTSRLQTDCEISQHPEQCKPIPHDKALCISLYKPLLFLWRTLTNTDIKGMELNGKSQSLEVKYYMIPIIKYSQIIKL
jgi:hypothetical protein